MASSEYHHASLLDIYADRHSGTHLVAIYGPNFSGRSGSLRSLTQAQAMYVNAGQGIYIGPEVYNSLSGLASTVLQELRLHAGRAPENAAIGPLIKRLELQHIYSRNPFTLSGGEQALVAITSCLALEPQILAIDGAMEQVDRALRNEVIRWSLHGPLNKLFIAVADNCIDEWVLPDEHFKIQYRNHCRHAELPPLGDIRLINCASIASHHQSQLQFEELTFGYQAGISIIRGVSATLYPGCIYFLEGANGAGKTTLAKLLAGLLRPSSGVVRCGRNSASPWEYPGQFVFYHFQNPDLQLFETTVLDEIMAGLKGLGYVKQQLEDRCYWALEAFGLQHVQKEHPLDLPFVARKRVALACALASGCPWIVLDEPTLGQDTSSTNELNRIMSELQHSGTGFVVVSHSERFRRSFDASYFYLNNGTLENRQ